MSRLNFTSTLRETTRILDNFKKILEKILKDFHRDKMDNKISQVFHPEKYSAKNNPIRKGKQETSNIENNSLDNPFNSSDISLPPIPGITIIATALSILSSQNHTGLTICNYAHASFNNRTNTHKHKHLSSGKNGGKLRRDLAGEGEPMEESGLRLLGSLAGPLFTPCSRVATNTASSFQQSSVIVTIDLDRNAHFLFAWPPAELG